MGREGDWRYGLPLTETERRVVTLLATFPYPHREGARALGITFSSFNSAASHAYMKMGVHNRAQLIMKFHEEGEKWIR